MTSADPLVADLVAALGPDRVRTEPLELALYAKDASVMEGRAAVVCFPTSTADVQAAVRAARRHGRAIVPRGSGTGLAGGAVIHVQIKSGTNALHGSAFEYYDSNATEARAFFLPAGQSNAKLVQNQFGANVGFPILKNKLFGFFDYQGYRQFYGYTYNWVVPTAKERQGDFSEFSKTIYDPCGRATTCGGRSSAAREQWVSRRVSRSG